MTSLATHCLMPGCGKRSFSRDLCHGHYRHVSRGLINKDFFPVRSKKSPVGVCRYLNCFVDVSEVHCPPHAELLSREPGMLVPTFETGYARYQPCAVSGCTLLAAHKRLCKIHQTRARNFKLDADQFLALLEITHCELCGREDSNLSIDHDHACCPQGGRSCGKCIRGMICKACNTALGMFRDDPDLMRKAAEYVESRKANF